MENKTILQAFHWEINADATHWQHISEIAHQLQVMGFCALWLPPAYKGAAGIHDVGYGVYDLYDLGEFDQKGSIPTKYGSKEEYLKAIQTLHQEGLEVYADIVFDHFMGADEVEKVEAIRFLDTNRNQPIGEKEEILAWTRFTFPSRKNTYNDYQWWWNNFKGVNYDEKTKQKAIFGFEGKHWEQNVDDENGNFDYLMGADLDMDYPETVEQLNRWGAWFQQLTQVDGYRLDAVKHIQFSFFIDWLKNRNEEANKEMFAVGEYWHGDLDKLVNYLDSCGGMMCLFDVPLHYNLQHASNSNGSFDMRYIFENTLLKERHDWAVTFVDNHDTQPGQSLESWVEDWFKLAAYALILLQDEGIPCVFYGDLYGIPSKKEAVQGLESLVSVRKKFAYGPQMDYFDHPDVIGFTRFGDDEHKYSGLAVVVTNASGGIKRMSVGAQHANEIFVDCTQNRKEQLIIEEDGCANFSVNDGSVSVWIAQEAYQQLLSENE